MMYFPYSIITFCTVIMIGCTSPVTGGKEAVSEGKHTQTDRVNIVNPSTETKKEDLSFRTISLGELPSPCKKEIAELKKSTESTYKHYSDNTTTYVMLALGARPTGGYDIQVTNVRIENNRLHIEAKEISPPKDSLVIQAFTFPITAIAIPNPGPFERIELQVDFVTS